MSSPSRSNKQYLLDIALSIESIRSFILNLTLQQYEADLKTQWAVERALLILAEAAYRLGQDADILCPGPPWREIRNLGNILRHGYDAISHPLI